ncbi:ATP-binding protein [Thalassiella azotivora]
MSGASPSTLAGRLRRAFGLLVLLGVVVSASGVALLSVTTRQVATLSTRITPAVETHAQSLQLMVDAETAVRGYLLTSDPRFLDPYREARSRVAGRIDDAERLASGAGIEVGLAAERDAARRWLVEYAEPAVDAVAAGAPQDAPSAQEGKATFDRYRQLHSAAAEALAEERQRVRDASRWWRTVAVPILVVVTLVTVTLAALVARSAVRGVVGPLAGLRGVLERLRMGEATARAEVTGPQEIRELARSANRLAEEGERLRAEQQAAATWRTRAREASRTIRAELERDAVLSTAARALGELVHTDRVWIRYADSQTAIDVDGPGPVEAQWCSDRLEPLASVPAVTPEALAAVRRLAAQGSALVVSNVLLADMATPPRSLLREGDPDARAFVVAPIEGNDDVIGIAVLSSLRPRDVGDAEVRAVQTVCADLGRALELSRVFEQQRELVDRLQDLDRQKTDFLSTVSHELRTPLTSIAGYVELLREGDVGELPAQAHRALEVVDRNAARLAALIEDLLTLSRIESGAFRTTVTDVDLGEVAASVVDTLRPQAGAAGVELRLDRRGRTRVRGDQGQLERVVLNLAGNAVKFTPAGGRVVVRVSGPAGDGTQRADGVVLLVEDTGIGIPVEDQQHLFERFYRAGNAVQGAVPGTGLGLTIVRSIVAHHGGALQLASAAGEGTTVRVRMPAAGGEQQRDG